MNRTSLVLCLTIGATHCIADMRSSVINMNAKNIHVNANFIAAESLNLKAKSSIIGKGLIAAPVITIKTKKFEFIGTIECGETCHIMAQEPFDETMFIRQGAGEFTITIDPELNLEETVSIPSIPSLSAVQFPPHPRLNISIPSLPAVQLPDLKLTARTLSLNTTEQNNLATVKEGHQVRHIQTNPDKPSMLDTVYDTFWNPNMIPLAILLGFIGYRAVAHNH